MGTESFTGFLTRLVQFFEFELELKRYLCTLAIRPSLRNHRLPLSHSNRARAPFAKSRQIGLNSSSFGDAGSVTGLKFNNPTFKIVPFLASSGTPSHTLNLLDVKKAEDLKTPKAS